MNRGVVLTEVDVDGSSLLVIPHHVAATALATWASLLHASTFGEVRKDVGAWLQVEGWLDSYREREAEEGRTSTGADDEEFNAHEFFGDDNWQAWTPSQREHTAQFLLEDEPEVAEEFFQPDSGYGLLVYESWPMLRPSDREAIEAALRARGHAVKAVAGLAQLYGDPTTDPATALARAAEPQS